MNDELWIGQKVHNFEGRNLNVNYETMSCVLKCNAGPETNLNQGSRTLILKQPCRGLTSPVSKLMFAIKYIQILAFSVAGFLEI